MTEAIEPTDELILRELPAQGGLRIGHATLRAEKSLNSITIGMVRPLDRALVRWAADPQIACVVLDGAGEKGLSAGGDVRYVREKALLHRGPGPCPEAEAFFGEEYRLDHRIHTYVKPILVWGSGIVMGGGVGLLAGASHRVVTQTSRIAMPEMAIGLFPDVGGSWFLPRMPGRSGLFVALTAALMNGSDALHAGLADFLLRAEDRAALLERLVAASFSGVAQADHDVLSSILEAFAKAAVPVRPASKLAELSEHIDRVTSGATLAEVRAAITSYTGDDPWLQRCVRSLDSGSPTTAALIWELFRRSPTLGLADVFRLDLVVALQCCAHPDFREGVRAVLVDKDANPRWTPASPEAVTGSWVQGHFAPLWAEGHAGNPLSGLGR